MQARISTLPCLPFTEQYLVLSHRGLSPTISIVIMNPSQTRSFITVLLTLCIVSLLRAVSPRGVATCTPARSLLHTYKCSMCTHDILGVTKILIELSRKIRKETMEGEKN